MKNYNYSKVTQKNPRIGIISIGQSPRPDIIAIFRDAWGDRAEILETGALDGLTHADVEKMTPYKGDDVLVVKMADGQQHIVGQQHLVPRIQASVEKLALQKITAAILLCTGNFAPFSCSFPFIIPQKIVDNTVAALVREGQAVGVMIPTRAQQQQMRRNLTDNGIIPVFASASPHFGEQGIIDAARQLQRHDLYLIVMHCFGYTRRMRDIVKKTTGKPVLLSNMLVAKVTGELLL